MNSKLIVKELLIRNIPWLLISGIMTIILLSVSNILINSIFSEEEVANLSEDMRNAYESSKTFAMIIPLIMCSLFLSRPIMDICLTLHGLNRVKNIEKRMKLLKKLGTQHFIDATKATFIDANNRGIELYESEQIISNKKVRFLIYRDTSTNEPYVSFVLNTHQTADEAMAWKLRLSVAQYQSMKREV